jgi:DNA-binding CsgD family transcriptional regulator
VVHPYDVEVSALPLIRRKILRLIGQGRSTAEIGTVLGVTKWSVYYHRRAIRKLLRVDSDRGLVLAAIELVMRQEADKAARQEMAAAPDSNGGKRPPSSTP